MTTQPNPDMPDYLWINHNDPDFHNNLNVEYESFDGGQMFVHERKYKAAIEALRMARDTLIIEAADYTYAEDIIEEINKVIGETE